MSDFSNGLSNEQLERLAMLAEEAGEVVQIVGKILRHGYESYHPADTNRVTNREHLERELTDLLAVHHLMVVAGDVLPDDQDELDAAVDRKLKWAHHQ